MQVFFTRTAVVVVANKSISSISCTAYRLKKMSALFITDQILFPSPSPFPKKKQPECFRQLPELLRRLPMFRRADDYRSKLNAKMASSAKSPLPPRPQSVPVLSQSMNSDLYSYRLLNSGFRSPLVRNISVVYQHLRSIYELISCFLVRCHQKVNSSVFARLIIDEKTVISGQYFN